MIRYQLFPRSCSPTTLILEVVDIFERHLREIDSSFHNNPSNSVLKILEEDLKGIGFRVESSKATCDKIKVPVLFGLNNKIDKFFDADAVSDDGKVVIEVEAGRAVRNNQFLKDIFQACMMNTVEYLIVAVRNIYHGTDDFEAIFAFLETLYINGRLILPLKGIILIGY